MQYLVPLLVELSSAFDDRSPTISLDSKPSKLSSKQFNPLKVTNLDQYVFGMTDATGRVYDIFKTLNAIQEQS